MNKRNENKLGKRYISFSTLLRDPGQMRIPVSHDTNEKIQKKLNPRKYKVQMAKNKLKVNIRGE